MALIIKNPFSFLNKLRLQKCEWQPNSDWFVTKEDKENVKHYRGQCAMKYVHVELRKAENAPK